MKKLGVFIGVIVGVVLVLGFVTFLGWRAIFVKSVDKHEFAYSFNRWSGTIKPIQRSGWVTYLPWIEVIHTIDTRPYQISINADIGGTMSVSKRVLNAKLVRFNPVGLDTFIQWHGRDAGDNLGNMLEILKAYAFDQNDGRDCPFLKVEKELAPKLVVTNTVAR
jgi:hypothetical protein